jgi:hypothetical protein
MNAGPALTGPWPSPSTVPYTVFRKVFQEEFSTIEIQFRVPITQVYWRDGIARLQTPSELPAIAKPFSKAPIQFSSNSPFYLRITREQAALIRAGSWITFTGKLKYVPIGEKSTARTLYSVTPRLARLSPFGSFVCTEYELKIGDQVVPGVWPGDIGQSAKK